MEKNKDYEKRLGRRLREAYMNDYKGPAMSREDFHRLIETAEKKKKRKKAMIGLAAACVALCLVCGGFVAGISMRESASAGKDDETKTVQQGGSVVIGSGVSENDQNVGVSVKTYTNIEDMPEDLREQIHFLDSEEFELEKVKVTRKESVINCDLYYNDQNDHRIEITEVICKNDKSKTSVILEGIENHMIEGIDVYKKIADEGNVYIFEQNNIMVYVISEDEKRIEAILNGLIG